MGRLFQTVCGLVIVCASLAICPRPAQACGWWTLNDFAKKREVSFDVTYVRTKAKGAPENAYMKPIAVAVGKLDQLTCSMRDREVVIRGRDVFAGKKQMGTIDGDRWQVGGHTFQVAVTDLGEKTRVWRWRVLVHEGEVLVASGDAMSFACVNGGYPTTEDHILDVLRHLMCYLLAREQPGMKLEDMPWNHPNRRQKK